jgi:TRAP-type transport system periplasmic protein
MKKFIAVLCLVAIVVPAVFLAACAPAAKAPATQTAAAPAKVYKLTCQSVWPPNHAMELQGIEPYLKKVEAASNGRIKIDIYTAGQLVPTTEALNGLQKRTFDMMAGYPTYWTGKFALLDAIGAMPTNFQDREAFLDFWTKTNAREICDSGLRKMANATIVKPISSSGMYVFSKVPINKFEDFKGLTMRCAGGAFVTAVKNMGAAPVANVAGPDTYIGMQKGTMDAAIFPIHGMIEYKLFEVSKYLIGPPLANPVALGYIAVNVDAWNELPPDLQKLFLDIGQKHMVEDEFPWYNNYDKKNFQTGLDAGMKISTLPAEDQAKFATALIPVWDTWMQQCTDQGIGDQARQLKALIDKHWADWAATHK